ncbi:MAG TPA: hypothetical protein VFN53_06430 [Acidobacteriaceae bacterium]|nr:hypothetical protein [Acidobacteriaceae bacterium]
MTTAVQSAAPIYVVTVGVQGPPGVNGSGIATATFQHDFMAAGSFNFVHNLNCIAPLIAVYVVIGTTNYSITIVDVNTVSIDVTDPCTLNVAFAQTAAPTVV